jgi:hypothetical protein
MVAHAPRPPRRLLLASLLAATMPAAPRAQPAGGALTVGPGQRFATLAAAIAAARDGDEVLLRAGTYTDEFAIIGKRVTIRSTGGMARLVATQPPPNGKAILVIGADVTIEGLEFTGTANPSQNGAGIRYEGGNLTIRRSHFHGNQMNLLAAAIPDGSITIEASEFGPTRASTSLSHSLYVNGIRALVVRDSFFHGALTGHQIKSRAFQTTITGTRIFDDQGGASYSVDLPNGGVGVLTGNVIEQGPNSRNPAIVNFGGEGWTHPVSSLRLAGNTVFNRLPSPGARLVANHIGPGVVVADNRIFGLDMRQLASGAAALSGNTSLSTPPTLDRARPWQAPPR